MRLRLEARWLVLAAGTVFVAALLPLLWNKRFYFYDDTQSGAFGIWYQLGSWIREGHVPLLQPDRWAAGNLAAEGQWGLFNPVIWVIALAATYASSALVFSTVVKVLLLVLAGTGTYVLARSYKAAPVWAFVAAVTVPFGGFTSYFDSPSWVTGLLTWALVPWFWAATRRFVRGGRPWWAFVVGYLIVSVGYVHGTIMVVAVLLATLVEGWLTKEGGRFLRWFAFSASLGLVALAVYLPGVLTAGVTVRNANGVTNDNFLVGNLSGLIGGTVPTARAGVAGWWGQIAPAPILYLSWILPMIMWVDAARAKPLVRRWSGLLVVGGVALLGIIGPSYAGPLRFPVRLLPYLVLAAVVLVVTALSQAMAERPSWRRLVASLTIIGLGWWLGWSQVPRTGGALARGALFVAGMTTAIWLVVRRDDLPVLRRLARVGTAALVATAAVVATVGVVAVQHQNVPSSPLPDFGLPGKLADYRKVLADVPPGDVIVIGTPTALPNSHQMWDETLLANTWYLTAPPVQNVYTPISFAAYSSFFCMNWRGETCPDALGKLFSVEPTTGEPYADLLGVSNVQLLTQAFSGTSYAIAKPPAGWHISSNDAKSIVWSRDEPVPGAGAVVWSSPGLDVQPSDQSSSTASFTVGSSQGGRVVLSRLAWPGYRVSGGKLAAPTSDFLVTVDVPAGAAGRQVTVHFAPPGWTLEVGAIALAVAGIALWSVADVVLRRRRRGVGAAASTEALLPEPVAAPLPSRPVE